MRIHSGVLTVALAVTALLAAPQGAYADKIWRPGPDTTWQWQIVGKIPKTLEKVDMYDIDLEAAVPSARTVNVPGFGGVKWKAGENAGVIDRIHAAGKVAICYLDTGAYESYRPDAKLFPKQVIGANTGWDDENWLDIRPESASKFAPIIWARLDLAKQIGCDGVEPDQNNPLGNSPGFPITAAHQKAWYLQVARQAHARGLSVGMKNGVEVIDRDTVAAFDWALNEECFYYSECDEVKPFIDAGKAVFQTEFVDVWKDKKVNTVAKVRQRVCSSSRTHRFATLIKSEVPDRTFQTC
ncbi:endo alpha-1,4 polygalactosaminidase [Spongiactinospora sp. TRM90649]|uniref:endo alpha-1,4 polygalactosaminidase n=1 Tax=Spongiactinospora sp. TRM90649 TaxID=3031114 RepID=UPI0023F6FC1B|nr:endo alpha-1,4 polygalactosaminidase [Spongiactinospora sp. TRM90649]MDF5755029.1 endo alpha-1,4 polygalactosaminidase [Spongiactinospora sp. TRM90649]